MKKHFLKVTAVLTASAILFSSCSSHTLITSIPEGAKVYLNEEYVGTTPYNYRDTKIVGTTTTINLKKEGYKDVNTSMSRNEEVDGGAIVGGLFLLFPFLWTMKYKPAHTYEMTPVDE